MPTSLITPSIHQSPVANVICGQAASSAKSDVVAVVTEPVVEMVAAPEPVRKWYSSKPSMVDEVRRLFAIYRTYTGREPMAGGAQNLLRMEEGGHSYADLFEVPEEKRKCRLDLLPLELQLRVLTYLSPTDMCKLAQVSRRWAVITEDEFLWNSLLKHRMTKWKRVCSEKNPEFYRRAFPDMSTKQIYIRCHPNSIYHSVQGHNVHAVVQNNTIRIPQFLSYIVPVKSRLVMFGPGLETRTSRIVRQILTDQYLNDGKKDSAAAGRFQVTGMIPGEIAGMGSGISLRLNAHQFNLITLYSNAKSVRQRLNNQDRVQHNKLFITERRGEEQIVELSPSVRELCRKTDGFVFIVDATSTLDHVVDYQAELLAMLCEIWSPVQSPLLVLVCDRQDEISADNTTTPTPRLTPVQVANALKLGRLRRKWMVQAGDVSTLDGIRQGFQWVNVKCAGIHLPNLFGGQ